MSAAERFIALHDRVGLVRVVAAGSVDDGKSTLIGRLLHDTGSVTEDQRAALLRDNRRHGHAGDAIDWSLLVDGLAAEREQGITIDVAWRQFGTARRRFLLADAPGHEQYTRNMATGASLADAAILLVDARRGACTQTKRHAVIAALFGVRHVVVAVNKMDLAGWDERAFERVRSEFAGIAARLPGTEVAFVPVSALHGDNVATPGAHARWYRGPTLLEHLESVTPERESPDRPAVLPVQSVARPRDGVRSWRGTLISGALRRGQTVALWPSGRTTRIAALVAPDGEPDLAVAPAAVTVALADDVDLARGDVLAAPGAALHSGRAFRATLVWMGAEPLRPDRDYLVKHLHALVPARLDVVQRIDLDTLAPAGADALGPNEIGDARVTLQWPIVFDLYASRRAAGAFLVIDRVTNDTVGAGMIVRAEEAR